MDVNKGLYEELKKYSILIVEDDLFSLNYLSKILKRFFNHVVTATDGYQAYEKAISHNVDMILTDMRMPYQNGADFIKQIREKNVTIPVVFMSAHTDADTLLKVIPLNVSEYLIKPIQVETFLQLSLDLLTKHSRKPQEYTAAANLYTLKSGVTVDVENRVVMNGNETILLTKKEFELLSLLITNRQSVLSKFQIECSLWDNEIIAESSVKTLIKKLRFKIGEESILTVTNLGYQISLSPRTSPAYKITDK